MSKEYVPSTIEAVASKSNSPEEMHEKKVELREHILDITRNIAENCSTLDELYALRETLVAMSSLVNEVKRGSSHA
jgi:uncharacterized protein YigA (DUF484 family)